MDKKAKIALLGALVLVSIVVLALVIAKPERAPRVKPECMDKIDNDGDGLVDLADSGCDNKKDADESNCGDTSCEGDETCSTCEADCGVCPPVCGDAECNGDETCSTCEADCGICPPVCGDGECNGDETCETCSDDCGSCPEPDSCSDTDYGWVPEIQGTVSGYLNDQPYSNTDYCLDSMYVMEYACLGTTASNMTMGCLGNSTGCVDGACG